MSSPSHKWCTCNQCDSSYYTSNCSLFGEEKWSNSESRRHTKTEISQENRQEKTDDNFNDECRG